MDDAPLPTAVYIDGYNLYYGRIRGTGFKWLDLVALCDRVLRDQNPNSRVERVRYFTAHALARFSSHGGSSVNAQQDYHRALLHLHSPRLEMTLGTHSMDRNGTLLPKFIEGVPYDRTHRVRVWKIEEKQTDVNLALGMYRDACSGAFKQMVVCSNDSDVAPVLRTIHEDFPEIVLGVITPVHPPAPDATHRRVSKSISDNAAWTRHYLLDEELRACQLPDKVPTARKPIRKPAHW